MNNINNKPAPSFYAGWSILRQPSRVRVHHVVAGRSADEKQMVLTKPISTGSLHMGY